MLPVLKGKGKLKFGLTYFHYNFNSDWTVIIFPEAKCCEFIKNIFTFFILLNSVAEVHVVGC